MRWPFQESKYANYPSDEFRMEFYLYLLRTLRREGTSFSTFSVARSQLRCHGMLYTKPAYVVVWVDRPKPCCVVLPHAIHKF